MKATRQEQKRKGGGTDTPRTKTEKLLRNWSTEKGGGTRAKRRRMKNSVTRSLIQGYTVAYRD